MQAAHPAPAERNGGQGKRGARRATNWLSCLDNIILNDSQGFQDADCSPYFPVFGDDPVKVPVVGLVHLE